METLTKLSNNTSRIHWLPLRGGYIL